ICMLNIRLLLYSSFISTTTAHSSLSTLSLHDALPILLVAAFAVDLTFEEQTLRLISGKAALLQTVTLGLQERRLAGYEPQGLLRSEEHTSELQSLRHLVCRLLLEKKKN